MKNTDHTVEEDIVELKQRFDTAPQMLIKQDYKHLVHTIEHLNGSVGECNKKQWRRDTQKAISKKKGLKYTDDGFAIADKTLTGRGYFYINEVIAIPNTDNVRGKYVCKDRKKETTITFYDIFCHFGYRQIPSGTIFILKTARDEVGQRNPKWDGKLDSLDLVILGENLHKIFVKHHSQKYINGRRVDYIIPRSIRKDSGYTGGIQSRESLIKIFNKLFASDLAQGGVDYQIDPGVTFYYWGRSANWSRGGQNPSIKWKKMTSWCYSTYPIDGKWVRNVFWAPTIREVFYFLAGTWSHKEHRMGDGISITYVKVTINDNQHGRMYEYKFRIVADMRRYYHLLPQYRRQWLLNEYNDDNLKIFESIK